MFEDISAQPDLKLLNGRIYNVWEVFQTEVCTNVLDWNIPVGLNEEDRSQSPSTYTLTTRRRYEKPPSFPMRG